MSAIRGSNMSSLVQPLAIALVAFAVGYRTSTYLTSRSLSTTPSSSNKKRKLSATSDSGSTSGRAKGDSSAPPSDTNEGEGATDTDSDAEDEAAAAASDIAGVRANWTEEVKLVLVVNDSLKMQKGKIAAQAGHATLACALMLKEKNPGIALRCASTEELDSLAAQARRLNLCARTIQDAGRTQVAPGSKTILGIGPGPARLINTVTGKLKLL
ncbi:Probable peptidyl-tRNA hydrolase 2 [Saitozyma sp. JCM 24511]|nr:Probable peptidyl-tRNA hydrolase 2 [Saitozyma sp. JCM 24511]